MVTKSTHRRRLRAQATHLVRVCLVISLLLAIPAPAERHISEASVLPNIHEIEFKGNLAGQDLQFDPQADANGMWRLLDDQDNVVGLVARTLPVAKDVVGYRGPTESLILLDTDLNLSSVQLLGSADTQEHVTAVENDPDFFRQFETWRWGGPEVDTRIDAVSGATLTSLALAEGILQRIGGDRPSLVFSAPLQLQEIRNWFPEASELVELNGHVLDASGKPIGRVLRTGPLSDNLSGYQGPTELLLKTTPSGTVDAIRIRSSFDNEPYVDYVRTEAGFWAIFEEKTIAELSEFDPHTAGVEGVSGATMTSLTVADTIVAAAKQAQQQTSPPNRGLFWIESMRWTTADVVTIATLLLAVMFTRVGWHRNHWVRRIWLAWVIVVIGLWAGNLISMALIAGWSAEGIAWRLAPGLSAIACVALLAPPLTKGNPYCNHLCPHGALQQLIRPNGKSNRRRKLAPAFRRWLRRLPGITLCAGYVSLVLIPTIDLASWEPFHAYLFRIAGWGSLGLACGTIAFSAALPMGYCRFGCPTGRLLDYLRRTAISDRIQSADYVAASLLVFALITAKLS